MKKTLELLIAYIGICIVGIVFGTILYLLFTQGTFFVAGMSISGISLSACKTGVLLSFPIVLMFSSLFLIMFIIRHPMPFYGICVCYILGAITWGVLFPFGIKMLQSLPNDVSPVTVSSSSGYFREAKPYIYYFSESVLPDSNVGVRFKTGNISSLNNLQPEILQNGFVDFPPSQFSDCIAEEVLSPPFFVQRLLDVFLLPQIIAKKFNSWADYLYVCSLGLALVLVGMFKDFSQWRLINILNSIVATFLILYVNLACLLKNSLFLKVLPKFDSFLDSCNIKSLGISFIVVLNCLIALFFLVMGLIMMLMHRRRAS